MHVHPDFGSSFKIKSAASKIIWLLNQRFSSSLKVVRKYLKVLRPCSCETLVNKLEMSNVTISVLGSTSLRHLKPLQKN